MLVIHLRKSQKIAKMCRHNLYTMIRWMSFPYLNPIDTCFMNEPIEIEHASIAWSWWNELLVDFISSKNSAIRMNLLDGYQRDHSYVCVCVCVCHCLSYVSLKLKLSINFSYPSFEELLRRGQANFIFYTYVECIITLFHKGRAMVLQIVNSCQDYVQPPQYIFAHIVIIRWFL